MITAKDKFFNFYLLLPNEARKTLIMRYNESFYSMWVVNIEVENNTIMGKDFLFLLGFRDD